MRFKRSRSSTNRNTKDERGRVHITIHLLDQKGRQSKGGWRVKKGNITKSLTLLDCTVSEVHKEILDSLVEEEE